MMTKPEHTDNCTQNGLLNILQEDSITISDRILIGCIVLPEFRWWCADRARLHAADALEQAGLHNYAQALRDLNPVVNEATAQAMEVFTTAAIRAAWATWATRTDRAARVAAEAAARTARTAVRAARAALAARADDAATWAAAETAADTTWTAERKLQLERLIEMAKGGTDERLVINPDELIGDWIDKKCPKCGARMLGNKLGHEWCSFTQCNFGCEDALKELGL